MTGFLTEGSSLTEHPASAPRVRTGTAVAAGIGVIVALDLLMVGVWTTWWGLGTLSPDTSLSGVLGRTTSFLAWTFLPCWAVGLVLLLVAYPATRRLRRISPTMVRTLITMLAPMLWAIGYCIHAGDPGYIPVAMLVAVGAWIVTLQPLWAYLVLYRLRHRAVTSVDEG